MWSEHVVLAGFKDSTRLSAATVMTHPMQYLECKLSSREVKWMRLVLMISLTVSRADLRCSLDSCVAEAESAQAKQKEDIKSNST